VKFPLLISRNIDVLKATAEEISSKTGNKVYLAAAL
jgi:hypothetical protein